MDKVAKTPTSALTRKASTPKVRSSEKLPKSVDKTPKTGEKLLKTSNPELIKRPSVSRLSPSIEKVPKSSSKSEELRKENETLKAKIESLEGQVATLETQASKVVSLESQVKSLSDGRQALLSSSDAWVKQEEQYKLQLKESKEKFDRIVDENEELRKQLKEADRRVERDISRSKEENGELVERIKQIEDDKRDLIDEYEERLAMLEDDVELITLDKEMFAVKCDTLQKEYDALKLEFDLLESYKASHEEQKEQRRQSIESNLPQVSCPQEDLPDDYQVLVDQNDRLKMALVKLTELSTHEKQDYEKTQEEYQRLILIEIPALEEKNFKLEEQVIDLEEQLEHIKMEMDENKDLQDQFESLLETKMDLEDEMHEMKRALAELESLRELSEELEEAQQETEKQLRIELYQKEVYSLDQESVINNLQSDIEGLNQTLERLSVHVRDQITVIDELRSELDKRAQAPTDNDLLTLEEALEDDYYEDEFENETPHIESTPSPNVDVVQSILQREASKMATKQLSTDTKDIECRQALFQLDLVRKFLPESIVVKEFDMINFLLSMKRIHEKSLVGVDFITEKFNMEAVEREFCKTDEKFEPLDESIYTMIQVRSRLIEFSTYAAYFIELFVDCDEETYTKLGKLSHEMRAYEKKVDLTLSLLQDDSWDKTYPFEDVDVVLQRFKHLHIKYCAHVEVPAKVFYTLKSKEIGNMVLDVMQHAVLVARKNSNVRPFSMKGLRAMIEFNRRVAKKIATRDAMIFKDNSKNILTTLSDVLVHLLDFCKSVLHVYNDNQEVDTITSIKTLKENLIVTLQDATLHLTTISEAIGLNLMEPIDIYVIASTRALYLFEEALTKGNFNGEVESEHVPCKILERRTISIREEFEKSTTLRENLEGALNEVKEKEAALTEKQDQLESLREENQQIDHLVNQLEKNEEELKETVRKLQKEMASKQFKYEDTLSDLQYQLETLTKEKATLAMKYQTLQEAQEQTRQIDIDKEGQIDSKTSISPRALEEHNKLVFYLKTKNLELTEEIAKIKLHRLLPPLPVQSLAPQTTSLERASQEIDKKLEDMALSLACSMAIDLTHPRSKPIEQLEIIRREEKKRLNSLRELREKVVEDFRHGLQRHKESDLNTFPDTLFTKRVHQLLDNERKPIVKMTVPCPWDATLRPKNPIQMDVNANELYAIHTTVVL